MPAAPLYQLLCRFSLLRFASIAPFPCPPYLCRGCLAPKASWRSTVNTPTGTVHCTASFDSQGVIDANSTRKLNQVIACVKRTDSHAVRVCEAEPQHINPRSPDPEACSVQKLAQGSEHCSSDVETSPHIENEIPEDCQSAPEAVKAPQRLVALKAATKRM